MITIKYRTHHLNRNYFISNMSMLNFVRICPFLFLFAIDAIKIERKFYKGFTSETAQFPYYAYWDIYDLTNNLRLGCGGTTNVINGLLLLHTAWEEPNNWSSVDKALVSKLNSVVHCQWTQTRINRYAKSIRYLSSFTINILIAKVVFFSPKMARNIFGALFVLTLLILCSQSFKIQEYTMVSIVCMLNFHIMFG